jgi:hypothetical protein
VCAVVQTLTVNECQKRATEDRAGEGMGRVWGISEIRVSKTPSHGEGKQ